MAALSYDISKMEAASLAENLDLLSNFLPPSKEFTKMLKADMFDRPNKPAMLHALHYLIPVFKPSVFKSKEIHWPVYSAKEEADFRGKVVKILTEYRAKSQLFEIPKTIASILSSGGGVKAIHFLLDLSTAALTLTLRKHSKYAAEVLDTSETLDAAMQFKMQADFCQEQEDEQNKFEEFIAESKIHEEGIKKKIEELDDEHGNLVEQLKQFIEQNECFTNADKSALLDISNNTCIDKRTKELDIQKNDCGIQFDQISEIKEAMNELSKVVQRTVSSQEDFYNFDGSKICPKELEICVNRLLRDKWLKDVINPFKNGQLNLIEYLKVVNASSKELLCSYEQLFNRGDGISIKERFDQAGKDLEELHIMEKNTSDLNGALNKLMKKLKDCITDLETELFVDDDDAEPNPVLQSLLADSPKITMPPANAEIDENATYEFEIDSPYVKNFAMKLLKQLKAQKKAGTGSPLSRGLQKRKYTLPLKGVATTSQENGEDVTLQVPHHTGGPISIAVPCTSQGNSTNSRTLPGPNSTSTPISFISQENHQNNTLPGCDITLTPISKEAPASNDTLPGPSCSSATNNKSNLREDAESDNWSPRGIFRLNGNIGDDMEENVSRLMETFAPQAPAGRRQSLQELIDRYKKIKDRYGVPSKRDE